MSRLPLVLAAAGFFALGSSPAWATPSVLVTIKPLHSLVAGVMEGVGAPALLIEGAASPHGFALRPSDARKLEEAEIVFWIGEELEAFLPGPLATLAGNATSAAMMEVPGMAIPSLRDGGLFETHSHEHEEEHDDHEHEAHGHDHDHDHDHGDHDHHEEDHGHDEHHAHERDAHIWLDPVNARLMVAAIAGVLMDADPANAAVYDSNGAALSARLAALEAEIGEKVAPLAGKPFFVFHDAYQTFEERFGLPATGSFTLNPEIAPGARRLAEIRARVSESEEVCLFAEPQFSPRVVETIAAETGARLGVLDPLGTDLAAGPEAYFTLMRELADSLSECLG